MQLLLLSNSTSQGQDYLGWPQGILKQFIEKNKIQTCLFVPYAGVTVSLDDYTMRVRAVFSIWGCMLKSIHNMPDPVSAVQDAECIVVGGGNTFRLVQMMHETGIMDAIRAKVLAGTPFIGWSAGSNVACPTLRTTNDMPVIMPSSFDTLNLVPFQINPHYLDANPEGFGGETREQRIDEFQVLNPEVVVVGLRETTALQLDGNKLSLLGKSPMRLFAAGNDPIEYSPGDDINFLMSSKD